METTVLTASIPIEFELNAVSNTGDWYQIMIGDNWCGSGLAESYEAWNNAQKSVIPSSGGTECTTAITLTAGDMVKLNVSIASNGKACMGWIDITHSGKYIYCVTQPDQGSSPSTNYLAMTSGAMNGNGYFTGPMTEIDVGGSSCVKYTLPTENYYLVGSLWVTQYTPYSEQTLIDSSGRNACYNSASIPKVTQGIQNADANFVEASAGNSMGPHWGAGQNVSTFSTYGWWEYETDAALTSMHATAGGQISSSTEVVFYPGATGTSTSGAIDQVYYGMSTSVSGVYPTSCSYFNNHQDMSCTPPSKVVTITMYYQLIDPNGNGYFLVSPSWTWVV
jgi:hypothetical protein